MSMHHRRCPHCNESIPLNFGFHFDEDLNLIHDKCGKVAFSTTPVHDRGVKPPCHGQVSQMGFANHSSHKDFHKFGIDT